MGSESRLDPEKVIAAVRWKTLVCHTNFRLIICCMHNMLLYRCSY
jgi:hypothetical protein